MNANGSEGQYEIRYVQNRFHVYGSNYSSSTDPQVNNGPIIGSVGSEEEAQQIMEAGWEPDFCRVRFMPRAYEVWMGGYPDFQAAEPDELGFVLFAVEESLDEALTFLDEWVAADDQHLADLRPVVWRTTPASPLRLVHP